MKLASSETDRASSSLLVASILFDRKKYADAESLLSGIADGTATKGLTPSAPRALFTLAEISVRLKKQDEAEKRWLSLISRFPNDALSEESLYRAAEMRWLGKDWARTAELFTQYRQKYPQGKFLEASLRCGGEALSRNGSDDLAILWWEDLVKKYPSSPSAPRTLSDLVDAYRSKGEYDGAIAAAEKYRDRYPSEAKADGIDRTIAELAVLKKGGASGTAALAADWEKSGRAKTPDGRAAGLALAKQYMSDYGTRAEAKNILKEISLKAPQQPDQADPAERSVFASALGLYGSMCRNDGDYRTASRTLLAAGKWYASMDGERSAEALYGAVDCFLQAGLRADAAKTQETLSTTWPESVWTKRARVLMEQ
ncbi:MAG TPA: tetratricopeptide repeat protein [Treponemataceae bacterium]|nr:tetratricopeptide repeat protein [Treponemataceae bacterium]